MIQFFREQKLLTVLLLVSAVVIIAGLFMIQYSKNIDSSPELTVQVPSVQEQNAQAVVDTMTAIAGMAEQQLNEPQTSAESPVMSDNIPQSSIDHVAALNGRTPEVGSNDWCEVMMVKKANEWTKEEQALFAKNCI